MVAKTEYKRQVKTLPFESIEEPGTYFSNWTGHLIRVPEDALKPGRSPVIEILGPEPMIVIKLRFATWPGRRK